MGENRAPDWRRMAAAARRRRAELGLRQEDVRDRMDAPIGIETIRRVEAGDQGGYRLTTLAAISRALEWPADMLERIAHGDTPGTDVDDRLSGLEARTAALEERFQELLRLVDERRRRRGQR